MADSYERIVKSIYPPAMTNVLWVDITDKNEPRLRVWSNGVWRSVADEADEVKTNSDAIADNADAISENADAIKENTEAIKKLEEEGTGGGCCCVPMTDDEIEQIWDET